MHGVGGCCPLVQEAEHLSLREGIQRHAGLLRLQQEVRGVERHLAVPRRVGAVRPHHEVILTDHRLHALDASGHIVLALRRDGVENAARADEREDARGGLLQTAMRIVRQPFERAGELADRRVERPGRPAPGRRRRPLAFRHHAGRLDPRHGGADR